MGNIVCKKCKTINKDTATICENCGKPITLSKNKDFVDLNIISKQPETQRCQYCQTEIPFIASVCPNCKRVLSSEQKLFDGISRFLLIIAIIATILFAFKFVYCETTVVIEPISEESTTSVYIY